MGPMKDHSVYCQTGERLNSKCVQKSVKCRGELWCFGNVFCNMSLASYADTCSVNANVYQILWQHVVPSLCSTPNYPAFVLQDNVQVSSHTTKQLMQLFESENTELMKYQPRVLILTCLDFFYDDYK